jgi:hypothetical protein
MENLFFGTPMLVTIFQTHKRNGPTYRFTKENVREKKTYWMRGVVLEGLQKSFPK